MTTYSSRPVTTTCCSFLLTLILLASLGHAQPTERVAPSAERFDAPLAGLVSDSLAATSPRGAEPTSAGFDAASFVREELVPGIGHYRFELQVGPGVYDRIGIHRVVEERSPYRPHRRQRGVFLAHGIGFGFVPTFLSASLTEEVGAEHSLPVFLAHRGFDVWGIDFRFATVPQDVADPSFMASWDLASDAGDLRTALAAVRLGRLLTGSGFGRLHLVGYSRGGRTGYTYLNAESQLPPAFRHVRGFVAVDAVFLADSDAARESFCAQAEQLQELVDAGVYGEDFRFFGTLGQLAEAAPDEPSPILPGLTNRQASLLVAINPSPSGFHLLAGELGDDGLPTGFAFTPESQWNRQLQNGIPFQPTAGTLQAVQVGCGEPDLPIDDHLAEVTVPVLYLGAGGGNAAAGIATVEALGSTDVTTEVVALLPPEERAFDLGHLDVFTASDADALFWQTIADWLAAR